MRPSSRISTVTPIRAAYPASPVAVGGLAGFNSRRAACDLSKGVRRAPTLGTPSNWPYDASRRACEPRLLLVGLAAGELPLLDRVDSVAVVAAESNDRENPAAGEPIDVPLGDLPARCQ